MDEQIPVAFVRLSGRDLQAIYHALDELPGKIGRPVLQSIQAQVQQQLDAHARHKALVAGSGGGYVHDRDCPCPCHAAPQLLMPAQPAK